MNTVAKILIVVNLVLAGAFLASAGNFLGHQQVTKQKIQDITDEHLESLMGVFERRQHEKGDVLFEAGDRPTDLLLLGRGEVALHESDDVRFRLRPIAPIGELGAITGLRRYTTAKVTEASEVWRIPTKSLLDFLEAAPTQE